MPCVWLSGNSDVLLKVIWGVYLKSEMQRKWALPSKLHTEQMMINTCLILLLSEVVVWREVVWNMRGCVPAAKLEVTWKTKGWAAGLHCANDGREGRELRSLVIESFSMASFLICNKNILRLQRFFLNSNFNRKPPVLYQDKDLTC